METTELPPSVTVEPGPGGLAQVRVTSPLGIGTVSLHGATVTSWMPEGAAYDLLFVSPRARFEPGTAIRGGIPLCAPWFGPGRTGDRRPAHGFLRTAHGFLRTAPWTLTGARDDGGTVTLDLTLPPETYAALPAAAGWPADAVFTCAVTLGADLTLALAVTAGASSLEVDWALHAYLRVGDVRRVTIDGLDGADYVDKVDGGRVKRQHGPLTLTGETDRVYAAAHPVTVTDPVLGRTLAVAGVDNAQTVVWNPFADKAAGMPDLGDAWPDFVCVESAAVLDRFVTVGPGATARLGQRIALR